MLVLKYIFYFIFLHWNVAILQLNLYYTDQVNEKNDILQHTCFRIVDYNSRPNTAREIMSYCMNELSSKYNIEKENYHSKFTFADLSKQKITSEQLYLWSASIDLIERYQFYLNQLSTTQDLLLGKQIFYNCTLPRFGPVCQYELQYYNSHYSDLNEIIEQFYSTSSIYPSSLTCYTHLQCNHNPSSICLDWSEICDGRIDCLNDGIDEINCWQLEINECQENEYRCYNGQCIPHSFYRDNSINPDCIDGSDEKIIPDRQHEPCRRSNEPSFKCEDLTCLFIPLTSSCNEKRSNLLMEMMYSNNNDDNCWTAFKCLIKYRSPEYTTCNQFCQRNDCKKIVMSYCPKDIFFPNVPVLFNNIYFLYRINDLNSSIDFSNTPLYICYNNTSDYDVLFINLSKISINNMKCIYSKSFLSPLVFSSFTTQEIHTDIIRVLYKLLVQYHLPYNYTSTICNRSNMYSCLHSSKCISIHRLMNNISDCPHMDDENIDVLNHTNMIEHFKRNYFKCQISNKYIHPSLVANGICDCGRNEPDWCEDEDLIVTYLKTNIIFQHICDGFIDLLPLMITGRNETDETECEQWQCDNIYTHCDGVWNCPNGIDESGCYLLSSDCSLGYHQCVSLQSNQLICLTIEKINDDHIDCLGGTDELKLCRTSIQTNLYKTPYAFHCMNKSSHSCISDRQLCDGVKQCENGDDERFCTTNQTSETWKGICTYSNYEKASKIERFLCNIRAPIRRWKPIVFKMSEIESPDDNIQNNVVSSSSLIQASQQHQHYCHRGFNLHIWLSNKTNLITCLCPPSYYGNQCQYQNQRISLVIQFRTLSDSWQTLFTIMILLIDNSDQRLIHSYEQFTYLSIRDCKRKFNIYLIYSTRPKDLTKNYSIHIDIYEKNSLTYRSSVLFPVMFSFLPVHRSAFIVDIPQRENNDQIHCFDHQCIHGKCIRYSNNPRILTFCQCDEGWSGQYCTIQYNCTCASNSLCLGISAHTHRSICICPLNKFGSRCLLDDTTCQTGENSTCQNDGQCISDENYLLSKQKFTCICPKGYSGEQCEISDNQLILSFHKDIMLSQSIFIHFIEIYVIFNSKDSSITGHTFQLVPLRHNSITIYRSEPFHLVFVELFNKTYYLSFSQNNYNQSTTIVSTIYPSDRCPYIDELFNETFLQLHLLHRIKYYHLPCQNQSLNLSCFYDEIHLCLCYNFEYQRLVNCFKFNHNTKLDCFGQNECENDGQCLQDKFDCPTKSICYCSSCFYGRRCQFSTNAFGLSLDAILGHHIIPHFNLNQQSFIIKLSLTLTIIFILIGLINSILSLITFKNKTILEVGCGIYLLGTSIAALLTTILFGLKFFILLLSQMSIISNRLFLQIQCHSLDFLLRICLCMDQWLMACVAIERAFTTTKGLRFIRSKSKQASKFVISSLLFIIIGTCLHDGIYRDLIDEENDIDNTQRIWCIVKYSSNLRVYNYMIHIFHFIGPFLINLVSAIILITNKSRQQSRIHPQRAYQEILREQFKQQKHLIISPIVLVILALPRLIIVFISKCMKSATNDIWLYLIGYFISFIPSMLTFVIFILPSKSFRKILHLRIRHYQSSIRQYFQLIL